MKTKYYRGVPYQVSLCPINMGADYIAVIGAKEKKETIYIKAGTREKAIERIKEYLDNEAKNKAHYTKEEE